MSHLFTVAFGTFESKMDAPVLSLGRAQAPRNGWVAASASPRTTQKAPGGSLMRLVAMLSGRR